MNTKLLLCFIINETSISIIYLFYCLCTYLSIYYISLFVFALLSYLIISIPNDSYS